MNQTSASQKTKVGVNQLVLLALIFLAGLAGVFSIYMTHKQGQFDLGMTSVVSRFLADDDHSTSPMSLRLGLIRLSSQLDLNEKIQQINDKSDALIADHGSETDLILTPEYSLTSTSQNYYNRYAINFDCQYGYDQCQISHGGGIFSDEVLAAIESLRTRAVDQQLYIFLGTVVESFDAQGIPDIPDQTIYFNDLVIINPQGDVSIKRKSNGDWKSSCAWQSDCWHAIDHLAIDTVRSIPITTRQGETIQSFPIICGERFYQPMLDQALNLGLVNLDILILPEREGDMPYQTITEAIQNGTWTEEMPGWEWGIEDELIPRYIDSGIIRTQGYLAVSDGAMAQGGLINLVNPPAPVSEYELTDNYMYGLIQYCEDGTIEGQCSDSQPGQCQNRELTDNCEDCGCLVGYRCQPDLSCKKTGGGSPVLLKTSEYEQADIENLPGN